MRGIELSARFAWPPNTRKYCGKPSFQKAFSAYLENKNAPNALALEAELKQFKAHYAYLKLIARANELPVFHEKVCEALWLGNRLLENVEAKGVRRLITTEFCGPGLLSCPKARALVEKIPDEVVPHHSFHAIFVHTITGVIKPTLENADACIVSSGRVARVEGENAIIESKQLIESRLLSLKPCVRKISLAETSVEKGDIVATHWNAAVMKITGRQAAELERYTKRNINAANECGVRFST